MIQNRVDTMPYIEGASAVGCCQNHLGEMELSKIQIHKLPCWIF